VIRAGRTVVLLTALAPVNGSRIQSSRAVDARLTRLRKAWPQLEARSARPCVLAWMATTTSERGWALRRFVGQCVEVRVSAPVFMNGARARLRRPTRADRAGRAYLDLGRKARGDGWATNEYLRLYVLEGFLTRPGANIAITWCLHQGR
jgi:hypothetical protein